WAVDHREEFWATLIGTLRIRFRVKPARVLDPTSDPTRPDWLPGSELNIAESCLQAEGGKTAILSASETAPEVRRVTYAELRGLSDRVARGLDALGLSPGDRLPSLLPSDAGRDARASRPDDLPWDDFLGAAGTYEAVACLPGDPTNILFSSGTTKDPKAIPWSHTTPIKAAADAYLHHDVR